MHAIYLLLKLTCRNKLKSLFFKEEVEAKKKKKIAHTQTISNNKISPKCENTFLLFILFLLTGSFLSSTYF